MKSFKKDGLIEKYFPDILQSFQKGDGSILSTIIKIFRDLNFIIVSPRNINSKFFLDRNICSEKIGIQRKNRCKQVNKNS